MSFRYALHLIGLPLLATLGLAQNGDQPGEAQPDLPADLVIPAAPVLSVSEALAAFQLAPGFRIECVASEPLVEDPVCMAFDGDGRLWVAEMRGYMPDADGKGEDVKNGYIAILTDTDGDGDFDARTNFLEGLVLPRAVLPFRDGALVISPPNLSFYRDTDGDDKADEHEVIATGLGGLASPEHAINGLRWTLDNWIQCSNHHLRFRETAEGWITQRTNGGGQWGLAFDEEGRAYFNGNSDPLRGDAYSSHYAVRNTNLGTASGVNYRLAHDMQVWPSRITPGVNRGYRKETLRDDFTLRSFTGASGPLIYLGAAFPDEFRGNAFVPEPCGNLVKRFTLHARDELFFEAKNAYEGREFLTSTDERFRPVNLYDGPDGALYIVDMYRGLLQHRLFVTSWLRKQVDARGLAEPLGLGRIWRVVHYEMPNQGKPALRSASWTELTQALSHPNGWWRLRAQQLIVEEGKGDNDAVELCRTVLAESESPYGRMHALWALVGVDGLDVESLKRGLEDADPRVARAAVRCAEGWLSTGHEEILDVLGLLARSDYARLRHQCLLSLGEANTRDSDALLADLLFEKAESKLERDAVLSGIGGREIALLLNLMEREAFVDEAPGRADLLRDLARCITSEGQSDSLDALLAQINAAAMTEELGFMPFMGWRSTAMIEGWMAGRPKGPKGEPRPVALASEPKSIVTARWLAEFNPTEKLREMLNWITWPGGPNAEEGEPVRPLTEAEQAQFELGREVYGNVCATCHQSSGQGSPGIAPPLRYSPWLIDDKLTPIRILVGGLSGPIEVAGEVWNLDMPVHVGTPEEIAAVLTYARREWGHGAEPITAKEVTDVIAEFAARGRMWTAAELEAAKGKH